MSTRKSQVAPHVFGPPLQLSKHLNPVPSEAQSASVEHVAEHDIPATEHPPSGAKTERPRQAPLAHSLPELQISPAGLLGELAEHASDTTARGTAYRASGLRTNMGPGYR